jgi:hypothetical protein
MEGPPSGARQALLDLAWAGLGFYNGYSEYKKISRYVKKSDIVRV